MNETPRAEEREAEVQDEAPATAEETRRFLLERSGRSFAPIEKSFVQNPNREAADRQGPLAEFVRNGDQRGLNAFLFLHHIISSGGPDQDDWSTTLSLKTWARVFGVVDSTTGEASARSSTSKLLGRLEQRRLIRKSGAANRQVKLTLLRPDGSGSDYHRPRGLGKEDRFLKVPEAYWLEGWWKDLNLPETAMLLVALHEGRRFELPTENMQAWYGFSPDTAERGFSGLHRHGLLTKGIRRRKRPLAPEGFSMVNHYQLTGSFAAVPEAGRPGERRPCP